MISLCKFSMIKLSWINSVKKIENDKIQKQFLLYYIQNYKALNFL